MFVRWRAICIALTIVCCSLIGATFAPSLLTQCAPFLAVGVGIGESIDRALSFSLASVERVRTGTFETALYALMGALAERRGGGAYGTVYGLTDAALAAAHAIGPLAGAPAVQAAGLRT